MKNLTFAVVCAVAAILSACANRSAATGGRRSLFSACADKTVATSGNPVFDGWYADPEGAVFEGEYWIYPTYSQKYEDQLHFDAFSSPDLVTWTKHENIITSKEISWLRQALWAPSVVKKDSLYYLFFGANDVHEGEIGGIGVAVADNPAGPFRDALGHPLIGNIVNGAQPIDQFVYNDPRSGDWYMYYGGWGHCNVVRLNESLTGLIPFEDGTMFREITPEDYVEGPFMLYRNDKYYFMWSEGGWGDDSYRVAYAISDSPFGPFSRRDVILKSDPGVATGAGHHSVIPGPGEDEWYIVYHRHPLPEKDDDGNPIPVEANNRVVCIDRLEFAADGTILPVKMTFEGVAARPWL